MTTHTHDSRLTSLAPEILINICEVLANTHAPSLVYFSLVNHACYDAAQFLLVRTVRLVDSGSDRDIAQQVSRLLERLRRDGAHSKVFRLVLGIRPSSPSDLATILALHHHWEQEMEDPVLYYRDAKVWGFLGGFEPWGLDGLDQAYESERRWSNALSLVKSLPSLQDFVFACHGQLPTCLLRALTANRPSCKIHLYNFNLWSKAEEGILKLDPRELELITSPLVHTVGDIYSHPLIRNKPGKKLCFIDGEPYRSLFPNVKAVLLIALTISLSDTGSDSQYPPVPLTIDTTNMFFQRRGAAPEYLSFSPTDFQNPNFQRWRDYIDLSALRVLEIRQKVPMRELEALLAGINTERLESLSVRLDEDTCTLTATDGSANWFLGLIACSKVKYLQTRGLYDADISNMISPTLRSFHIDELDCRLRGRISGPEQLIQLGKNCPQLEDLHIGLTRSQGSAQEVACYAAIGRHSSHDFSTWRFS
ncbi:hypothetical protein QBC37DRAFT_482377 [Rhypophila decipiens]|uniref:Uncharacterized protein n=1 Tax=Rhypophila decipiens TaxID=261697 RepID=A0AAN6Y962_9PEZI|nr:hypothetical protein QBC37DRAFT_482377 [Rhypophila decipiens]